MKLQFCNWPCRQKLSKVELHLRFQRQQFLSSWWCPTETSCVFAKFSNFSDFLSCFFRSFESFLLCDSSECEVRNECVHLQTRNLIICRQNNNMPNSCCVLWQLRSIKAAWKIRADDVSVLIAAFGPWSQDLPISTALVTLIYSWWIFQSGPMLIGCTYVCLHDDSV